MRICMVRHGETEWNRLGKLQGREDIPLNALGRVQAREVADALGGSKWGAVVTSPLLRAKQTAEIIAERLGIPHAFEESGFMERDYGLMSGLTHGQRIARFPDGEADGMESRDSLEQRVWAGIRKWTDRFVPEDFINVILAALTGHTAGTGKRG